MYKSDKYVKDGIWERNVNNKQYLSFVLNSIFFVDDVRTVAAEDLEGFFHALRRLVASKAGFEAFTTLPK